MASCIGYAAQEAGAKMAPWRFTRREVGAEDVRIKITYCGICHSDLHQIKNEWGIAKFPLVPGHEFIGTVEAVGSAVADFKIGENVAIGCIVDSCRACDACKEGLEQQCPGNVGTYSSVGKDGQITYGGYSEYVIVNRACVLHLPESLAQAAGAPLLCAGITTYSALRYYGLDKPGLKIGVVGLGGLGHMAIKFLKAFGCHVTVFSTSEKKRQEAIDRLKADAFIVSSNDEQLAAAKGLDGIIDTVSASHKLLLGTLSHNGTYAMVGAPPEPLSVHGFELIVKRIRLGGSLIGGIRETQEMLNFCAEKNILADVEVVAMQELNTALDRLGRADVKYRFVLDVAGTIGKE
eukprot:NODE_2124_length_1288_cov_47.418079_g1932_i0.p1 GENE.NODE_2124_length_1288_cov_47.418079_g1932_i0~~NODE_2124_length_1288_cov_47.418079_g1932_i0.p1  ORF type:complete len:349 (+),score=73.26 NODE_2124_length_1288_cov_47.418079_g1932_i0:78-1124(+)